ncbi:MAG: DUF2029 domain-containing protein [Candidatus Kerfeldbacteria bacterium]|nr:DUF2029 domain-containing protein [Candidatus Kerfeldbacteria bacterium]
MITMPDSNHPRWTFLNPLKEVLAPTSARTWVLFFFGSLMAWLAFPFLRVAAFSMIALSLPLMVALMVSVISDYSGQPRSHAWIVALAIGWMVMLVSISLARLPKRNSDEALLTEVALQGMTQGINPYSRDYRGTQLDTWVGDLREFGGVHPVATRYIYLPGHLVLSMPFYVILKKISGWYDQRVVYLAAYLMLVGLSWWSLRVSPLRDPLVLSLALNPFLFFVFNGFNDLLVLSLLSVAGFAMATRRLSAAAVILGLAIATKQSAWVLAPFFLLALHQAGQSKWSSTLRCVAITVGVALLVLLPFVIWSPADFYDDTIRYFTSGSPFSNAGEGISGLLRAISPNSPGPFPFWTWQVFFSLPIVVTLLWRSRIRPSTQKYFFFSALALSAAWFFSRYFLPAHMSVIIILITLSFLIGEVERTNKSL